jgi:hypothetical protein
VHLIADNMNIGGTVTGAPFTTILPFSTTRGIDIGGSACEPSCNALSLTQSELNNIFGGGMIVGDGFGGSGDLVFVGNVAPGSSFLNIGGTNILQTGGIITAPLNVHASGNVILSQPGNQIPSISTGAIVGGNIQIVNDGDLTIAGTVHANGNVSLTSSFGAIIDNNTTGFDIIGAQIALVGATSVGTLANPIQTQTPLLSVFAGNEINILNGGDLNLVGLTLTGGSAFIGNSGFLEFSSPTVVTGNLTLLTNNGMFVNQNISATGVLSLGAGAGTLLIDGAQLVSGGGLSLSGSNVLILNNAFIGGMGGVVVNAAGNLEVRNDSQLGGGVGYGLTEITTGGSVLVDRGLIVGDPDVVMNVGGILNINGTLSQTGAIHAISPNSIHVSFPNGSGGGFFVNGIPNLVYDPATNTGFFTGNPPVPATLGAGLVITYGSGSGIALPSTVQQGVFGTLITALRDSINPPDTEKDVVDDLKSDKDKAPACR